MDLSLAGLAVLALVDSTSFGTLLIPIWFLLAPGRVRTGRLLAFLGTVAGTYLLVGVGLVSGAGVLLDRAADLGRSQPVTVAQAVVGAALLAGSFAMPGGRATDADGRPTSGRVLRWRDRAVGAEAGAGVAPLVALAVGAVVLELATMLPYLAATGIIASADLTWPGRLAVLATYCLVMVLPALVLLVARVVAHGRVEPLLRRIGRWMERSGAEATAWVVGVVGFFVLRDAVTRLPAVTEWLAALGVSLT